MSCYLEPGKAQTEEKLYFLKVKKAIGVSKFARAQIEGIKFTFSLALKMEKQLIAWLNTLSITIKSIVILFRFTCTSYTSKREYYNVRLMTFLKVLPNEQKLSKNCIESTEKPFCKGITNDLITMIT